eukprot:1394917-Amorphochlora_amoeboformis.AAC.2
MDKNYLSHGISRLVRAKDASIVPRFCANQKFKETFRSRMEGMAQSLLTINSLSLPDILDFRRHAFSDPAVNRAHGGAIG